MDSPFPSLANIHLPAHSRLLRHSCCPDKDVVIVFSSLGGLERISLYHTHHGTKIWETDIGEESSETATRVLGIAWSPDGRSVALLLDPPGVTLLSIQDGRTITTLHIPDPERPTDAGSSPNFMSEIAWFRSESKEKKKSPIPDIFRRQNIITGSTESILRSLPLLDPLQEESDKFSATNLFAFQGSQARSQSKSSLPKSISSWPTLSADPKYPVVDSSIQTRSSSKPEDSLDEIDESNIDSILMVTDMRGNIYSFLDGTFPLGTISIGREVSYIPMQKSNSLPRIVGHQKLRIGTFEATSLSLTIFDLPLLVDRKTRDLARLSTIARDLTWYIMRVVKDMKTAWFGTENAPGARDIGPRWVQSLKTKQAEHLGQKKADPILDLTYLLTTGRASRPLEDLLGGGEQMSDRGIQKWESIVSEALLKLRDYSEKRFVPACQRLQLVLRELEGWSMLPRQFAVFGLDKKNIVWAVEHTDRGIVLGSLLASVARRELFRFKEFMAWLRFEVANTHNPAETNTPRHDILEVNHYLQSGLASSPIDLWFTGGDAASLEPRPPVPWRSEQEQRNALMDTVKRAKEIAQTPSSVWPNSATPNPLQLVRNLVVLSDDLADRCQKIFIQAAGAPSRRFDPYGRVLISSNSAFAFDFRERVEQEDEVYTSFIMTPIKGRNYVVFIKITSTSTETKPETSYFVVACQPPEGEGECRIVAAEFFNEDDIILVYRGQNDQLFLAPLRYSDLEYRTVDINAPSNWETLVSEAMGAMTKGMHAAHEVEIKHRRVLGGKGGEVSLAVNGRSQRMVVCVLDGTGTRLDTFDLTDEDSESEEEPEEE